MSVSFILLLALVFIFFWAVTTTILWRMSRGKNSLAARSEVQPAIRLAEQWLIDSQNKMQQLVESSVQPLSAAQNELLELRLEAGRLPLGIKNLRLVRDALYDPVRPRLQGKGLAELAQLYLEEGDRRVEGGDLVFLKTSLGEMACLEVANSDGASLDKALKEALLRAGRASSQNPSTGGFLYFKDTARYQECLQNPQWVEGLKGQRLMAIDPQGLLAILLSLRLSQDAERVLKVFQAGVDSTRALIGNSDSMGEALSQLGADSLKLRSLMDGSGDGV